MVKAVIFDMDGVIIDSEPIHLETTILAMRHFGREITGKELSCYVGVSNPVMWQDLKEKFGLSHALEELLEMQDKYTKTLFGNRKLELIPGIGELLDTLIHSGIKIGLASSSPHDFITMILENTGIKHYFRVVVSGDDVIRSKPAPDIFLKAAALLDTAPADCLVIEDSGHGVNAAKSAGMRCIGFKNINSGQQDLTPADQVVHSIGEINFSQRKAI